MSSTLNSRWATDTDRRRADEGQNVSRFTVALQASRDLHPASDQQPQRHDNNRWTSSPTYNSTGWKRSNYQSDRRHVASSPSNSRPWNAIALKSKKPVEQKSSSPPLPPRQESESLPSTDTQAMQSIPITSSAQNISSNSIFEQQQQQQQQQQQRSGSVETPHHEQNPVSNHEHDDHRNNPHETRQGTLDEQMLNLRIESVDAKNNAADMRQKVLETEEVGPTNSQPQNSGSTTAEAYDIQEEIRREREANAARKLRAAQAREWDCDKSMEGWR